MNITMKQNFWVVNNIYYPYQFLKECFEFNWPVYTATIGVSQPSDFKQRHLLRCDILQLTISGKIFFLCV